MKDKKVRDTCDVDGCSENTNDTQERKETRHPDTTRPKMTGKKEMTIKNQTFVSYDGGSKPSSGRIGRRIVPVLDADDERGDCRWWPHECP